MIKTITFYVFFLMVSSGRISCTTLFSYLSMTDPIINTIMKKQVKSQSIHKLSAICFKCYFNGDESDKFEIPCNDGCVNVTKNGATLRNCWSKNDIQNEGCKIYDDEEICVCFTELCNFGQIQDPTALNSSKSFITTQSSSITTTPKMTIKL